MPNYICCTLRQSTPCSSLPEPTAPAAKNSEPDGNWTVLLRVFDVRRVCVQSSLLHFFASGAEVATQLGMVALRWPQSAWRKCPWVQQLVTIFGEGSDISYEPKPHCMCVSEEGLNSCLSAPDDRTRSALFPTTPGTLSSIFIISICDVDFSATMKLFDRTTAPAEAYELLSYVRLVSLLRCTV